MAKLIVYYSMSGNSEYAAKLIAEVSGADLLRIDPAKPYSTGFFKYLHGGRDAIHKIEPALKEYTFDSSKYDSIVFVSPVWAGTFAPSLRTFITQNKEALASKNISACLTFKGGDGEKALASLKKHLGTESFNQQLILKEPLRKKTEEKDELLKQMGMAL